MKTFYWNYIWKVKKYALVVSVTWSSRVWPKTKSNKTGNFLKDIVKMVFVECLKLLRMKSDDIP